MSLLTIQLVLRDNDIETVPKGIYKCTRLKTLHLQVNQINVLPPEISKPRFINLHFVHIKFYVLVYISNHTHAARLVVTC